MKPVFPYRCYASDEHLEVLYSSLVKTSLGREDVANLEKENVKNSHEVKQSFRNASKASKSYLYRTSLELVASVILMISFLSYGDIKGLARPLFDCDVHSILFKCVIPNSRFYYVSLLVQKCCRYRKAYVACFAYICAGGIHDWLYLASCLHQLNRLQSALAGSSQGWQTRTYSFRVSKKIKEILRHLLPGCSPILTWWHSRNPFGNVLWQKGTRFQPFNATASRAV